MAQEAVRPATVVTTTALLLAPLYNWLLIFWAGLGVHGAAYAMVAVQARRAGHMGRLLPPPVMQTCTAAAALPRASCLVRWFWHQPAFQLTPSFAVLACAARASPLTARRTLAPPQQATLALLLAAYCMARDRLLSGSPLATWHGFSRKAWSGCGAAGGQAAAALPLLADNGSTACSAPGQRCAPAPVPSRRWAPPCLALPAVPAAGARTAALRCPRWRCCAANGQHLR